MSTSYVGLTNTDNVAAASGGTSDTTNALESATTTVNVSSGSAPTTGQVLTATAATTATWQTPSGGFTSGCRVRKNSNQTVSSTTWTQYQMNTEDFDSDGEYNTGTYRFTATDTGKYYVGFNITCVGMLAGKQLIVAIRVNGAPKNETWEATNAGNQSATGSDILSLNATDYVELWGYHDNGVSKDFNTKGFMTIHRLS